MSSIQQTFVIPSQNLETLRTRLVKLAKKAAKIGTAAIEMHELGEYWTREVAKVEWTDLDTPTKTYRIRKHVVVEVTGETPKMAGWSFRASVLNGDFLGDAVGAVIKAADSSIELPEHLRAGVINPNHCSHCNTSRRRKDTFLVQHDDGSWAQVGRQCLKDFLGHKDPAALARGAEYVLTALDTMREAEEPGWGGNAYSVLAPITDFFIYVMAAVREQGYVSRGSARDGFGQSTADLAYGEVMRVKGKPLLEPEASDGAKAEKLIAWAEGWLASPRNDYQQNAANAFASGHVSDRTAGILASLAAAWAKDLEMDISRKVRAAAAANSTYVGTPKKRQEMKLTLVREYSWETVYGWMGLYKFADEAGNTIVWKTSKALRDTEYALVEVGETVHVKATVKEHSEYRGEKQTAVTRVTVTSAKISEAA